MSSDEDDDERPGLGAQRRRKRNQDDAIYGVFGNHDEDRTYTTPLMSKPIGFVSSSTPTPTPSTSSSSSAAVAASSTKRMKLSREDEERAFLGLAPATETPPPPAAAAAARHPVSRFGRRQAAAAAAVAASSSSSSSSNGTTTTTNNPTVSLLEAAGAKVEDKKMGRFEAHTKGFGAKMLAKMGFKGRLGKHEQGIATPILPTLRPRNAGLGMVAENSVAAAAANDDGAQQQQQQQRRQRQSREVVRGSRKENWATAAAGGHRHRTPRVYKTAADVAAQATKSMKVPRAAAAAAIAATELVVDMRGPHPHVSTLADATSGGANGSSSSSSDTPTGSAYKLPELQHNVRLLVSMCEADIAQLGADRKHREDSVVALEHDVRALELQRAEGATEIANLRMITACVDECAPMVERVTHRSSDDDVHRCLVRLLDAFEQLQVQYPREYRLHNVTALAVSLAFPALALYLQRWRPLVPDSTVAITPVVMRWRDLLKHVTIADDPTRHHQQQQGRGRGRRADAVHNAYEVVVESLILPRLAMCISGDEWQPTHHHATIMILLESVRDMLPHAHYQDILYRVVLPKLLRTVRHWHPQDPDTTLLHTWVTPWREHMRDEWMQALYDAVVQRLCVVLQTWQPADVSALLAIQPWHAYMSTEQMHKLMMTAVVPKLMALMRGFEVNPRAQRLEPLQWFVQWMPLVAEHTMATIMRKEFWPTWLTALCVWLEGPHVNTAQVAEWYAGWKSVLPHALLQHATTHLRHALQLMNARMDSGDGDDGDGVDLHPLLTLMVNAERSLPPPLRPNTTTKTTTAAATAGARAAEMTFTEAVSMYAEVNGVAFVPNMKRGRYHGKQVYVFGDRDVYLDNMCAYEWSRHAQQWTPVALPDLLAPAAAV